jgi:glycosyltransferase involved in cell wall biosynthesis
MQRICGTLSNAGYEVSLVGRKKKQSPPTDKKNYQQFRISCLFNKGKLFYAEYNLRLFLFLFFKKMDAVCAIDLDTILPCLYISKWKKIPRVYDAHELFTELKEVITRPAIKNAWTSIERRSVPQFKSGYTVSDGIAKIFQQRYGVSYETIRNLPVLEPIHQTGKHEDLLYQGAVNEGRGLEFLVPAMKNIPVPLLICGDGNYMEELKKLISSHGLQEKITLMGMVAPARLREISASALLGLSFPEKEGLNQWFALPNKFFDYIHAGLPQVSVNYPEYKKINDQYKVAVLVDAIDPATIAAAVNNLLANPVMIDTLRRNCLHARAELCWQQEEKKLVAFYNNLFTKD